MDLSTDIGYSLSFIDSIIVKTEDLVFKESSNQEFDKISQRLTSFSHNISNIICF